MDDLELLETFSTPLFMKEAPITNPTRDKTDSLLVWFVT